VIKIKFLQQHSF